ncbi:Biofilm and cell wall regulator 1 [Mycena sanguinolenta]|uniref:Biofilm and cell wall regulator 1 n=1 Tax=Mycena sanguinolenta TaxID=230812 RepID=A0A8H6X4B4_9AGAR|nr:Biofilm and cell wall regulator 1 [Mycena sanguinolenta]
MGIPPPSATATSTVATSALGGSTGGGKDNGGVGKRYRPAAAKTFQCRGYGECKIVFSRSEHLARHIRKHTGERPFTCYCSKQFSRLDNLRQHAQTVHADEAAMNEAMMRELTSLLASMTGSAAAKTVTTPTTTTPAATKGNKGSEGGSPNEEALPPTETKAPTKRPSTKRARASMVKREPVEEGLSRQRPRTSTGYEGAVSVSVGGRDEGEMDVDAKPRQKQESPSPPGGDGGGPFRSHTFTVNGEFFRPDTNNGTNGQSAGRGESFRSGGHRDSPSSTPGAEQSPFLASNSHSAGAGRVGSGRKRRRRRTRMRSNRFVTTPVPTPRLFCIYNPQSTSLGHPLLQATPVAWNVTRAFFGAFSASTTPRSLETTLSRLAHKSTARYPAMEPSPKRKEDDDDEAATTIIDESSPPTTTTTSPATDSMWVLCVPPVACLAMLTTTLAIAPPHFASTDPEQRHAWRERTCSTAYTTHTFSPSIPSTATGVRSTRDEDDAHDWSSFSLRRRVRGAREWEAGKVTMPRPWVCSGPPPSPADIALAWPRCSSLFSASFYPASRLLFSLRLCFPAARHLCPPLPPLGPPSGLDASPTLCSTATHHYLFRTTRLATFPLYLSRDSSAALAQQEGVTIPAGVPAVRALRRNTPVLRRLAVAPGWAV